MLYDIEVMWRKTIKHTFSVLYSDKTWVFDQSERAYYPIYNIIVKYIYVLNLKKVREETTFGG